MQTAAKLLAALGDCIEEIKTHLATIDSAQLDALLANLPSTAPAGSAEMVMLVRLYSEIETRRLREAANVIAFRPTQR